MRVSIVHGLEAIARRAPASPALTWRGTRWTYADLFSAITSVRKALAARHLARGSRVALLLRNSPQYVALYYGVLAAGCVAVPLNSQERAGVLARQIEHSGASLLAGDPAHPEWLALNGVCNQNCEVVSVGLHDGEDSLTKFAQDMGNPADTAPMQPFDADELAAIIYTSGTTGRPKGVMLSHGNLASNAAAIISYLGLNDADRGLCVLPFHFSYGSSILHSHLLCGAQLVLEDNFAFPQVTLQRIQDDAITGFAGVPSTFALLLGRCRLRDFDLSRLRYITQAGGAMPRALVEQLREQLSGVQLFIMYGQTEATARLTYLPPARLNEKPGSVGIPVDGVEIDVRHQGQSMPPGKAGEICARGPNVMMGYWNDAAATAEVLRDGWLYTGDLGRRDAEGYLYIDGRSVEMIKVGAFRVSPQEIEEVIAAIDGVEEVAVTGIADAMLGQAVKAVVVPRSGIDPDVRAIKAHCRRQLAAYKVPKVVEFAAVLPRTASGKVQRFKLANSNWRE